MPTQPLSEEQKREITSFFLSYVAYIKDQTEENTQKAAKFQKDCLDDNIEALAEYEIILLENTLNEYEKSDEFDSLVSNLNIVWLMNNPPEKEWKVGINLVEENEWIEYGIRNYFRSTGIYDCILKAKWFEPDINDFIESIFELADIQEKYTSCMIVSTPMKLNNEPEHLPLMRKPAEWWAKVSLEFARRNYPHYYETIVNAPWINLPSSKILSNFYFLAKEHQDDGKDIVHAYNFQREKLILQLASPYDLEFSEPMLFNRNPCSACNTSAYFQIPDEQVHPKFRSYRDATNYINYQEDYEREAEYRIFDAKYLDLISTVIPDSDDHKRLNWVGKIFNKSCDSSDDDVKFLFLWDVIEALTKEDPIATWYEHTPQNLGIINKAVGSKFNAFYDLIRDVSKAKSALAHGDFRYDFRNFELAMQKYMLEFNIQYLRKFARFLILYVGSVLNVMISSQPNLLPWRFIQMYFETLKSESKLRELNKRIVAYWGDYWSLICP